MNPAKVYYTDLRTRDGDNLPKKLQRLIRAAGIADIDMEKSLWPSSCISASRAI